VIGLEEDTDVATRGRGWLSSLAGRRVTVVGLAKSGIAAARLLRAVGAEVTGADAKPVEALGREAAALREAGVRILGDGAAAFEGATLVVVSPGVPLDAPPLVSVRARGVPIIGELELGWRAMEADTIAITGTNGKTTTTALTGALLAEQARPVLVGGNIGVPLAAHALTFGADGLVVCEVSSFQLETTEAFHPRVAAVQSLIRLKASDACLAVVDDSSATAASRRGALRVLQSLPEPNVVDALITRLANEPLAERRAGLLTALCRLYFVDGEWKGDSWGTRPDTRGPFYQPDPWSETPKVAAALKAALLRRSWLGR